MSTEATTAESVAIPPEIQARLTAAESAVAYTLRRLREVPEIFWHCGDGTGLYDELLKSRALTSGKTEDEISDIYRPKEAAYMEYCAKRERERGAVDFLEEQLRLMEARDFRTFEIRVPRGQCLDSGDELLVIPSHMLRPAGD